MAQKKEKLGNDQECAKRGLLQCWKSIEICKESVRQDEALCKPYQIPQILLTYQC